jgi:hypothetical protein
MFDTMESIQEKANKIAMDEKAKNEAYLKSPEWKELLERARIAESKSYTVIYREHGELKEAWHWLCDDGVKYVKEKYKRANKEIVYFVVKEQEFGEYLKFVKGEKLDKKVE